MISSVFVKHFAGKHDQQTHGRSLLGESANTVAVGNETFEIGYGPRCEPRKDSDKQRIARGVRALVSRYGANGTREVLSLFNQDIGDLSVRIEDISQRNASVGGAPKIQFRIYDKENGVSVGNGTRIFFNRLVEHDRLELSRNGAQRTGFGTEFYRRSEKLYRELGIEKVTLRANLSIGGYAWAALGFDFADDDGAKKVRDRAEIVCENLGCKLAVPKHTYEIATLLVPGHDISDQQIMDSLTPIGLLAVQTNMTPIASFRTINGELKLGKLILLGTDWEAIKRLNDEESTRASELYFDKKEKVVRH